MLWDLRSGKIVQTLETKSPVTSAEVSQDGRHITTADGSNVKFWDANHFALVKSYYMPCSVESASLEPKHGKKFIAGGEDMWVHVFDFHTGEEIVRLQQGSPCMVLSTVYVPHLEGNPTLQDLKMVPLEYGRQARGIMKRMIQYLQMDLVGE
ncbi:hypothetical protein SCA6_019408 [Theobroma cacao]